MLIRTSRLGVALFLALASIPPGGLAQDKGGTLFVSGEVERPLQLTPGDLSKMARRSVKVKDHAGKDVSYEGVELREVLSRAGVKFSKEMPSKSVAYYVLVQAADKYEAVFALAELDPAFTDRLILLADSVDGKPLPQSNGPFQIVVDEKHHGRWVRQVNAIVVKHA